jgi:uncharacterized lipoprotein
MNFHKLIFVITIVAILSACSPVNSGGNQGTSYPRQGEETRPATVVQPPSGIPYPQFKEGDTILSGVAEGLLKNGSVDKITLKPSGEAVLLLKDGRALVILLPFEGAIQTWIDQCGDPCKAIKIIQE